MPTFMHMTMLPLFLRRVTHRHDLHVEMQLRTRQRMVEIETHSIFFNAIHARVACMTFVITHR